MSEQVFTQVLIEAIERQAPPLSQNPYLAQPFERHHDIVIDGGITETYVVGNGAPVLVLHGNPGTGKMIPHREHINKHGVTVVSFSRRGYGQSDSYVGNDFRMSDAAKHAVAVMDALGYERFGIMAGSGGTPVASTLATLYPERVNGLFLTAALAPPEAESVWRIPMTEDNNRTHELVRVTPEVVHETSSWKYADKLRSDPYALFRDLATDFVPSDMHPFLAKSLGAAIIHGHVAGLHHQTSGWHNETVAMGKPWIKGDQQGNLRPNQYKGPVVLWHGGRDKFNPYEHSVWLRDHFFPNVALYVSPDDGHFMRFLLQEAGVEFLAECAPKSGFR
jgi:pimeloyl-ACP methyl ester carboxylesterase